MRDRAARRKAAPDVASLIRATLAAHPGRDGKPDPGGGGVRGVRAERGTEGGGGNGGRRESRISLRSIRATLAVSCMMAPMLVRAAEASDLDALPRLWHESWHDGHAHFAPAGLVAARTLPRFRERLTAALA